MRSSTDMNLVETSSYKPFLTYEDMLKLKTLDVKKIFLTHFSCFHIFSKEENVKI